tara:strand:- start:1914 stop:2444 length:531 start_codon:yes stop_codon:yes gene_type:complete
MNYSGNPATICDYITVFFEDGNVTNGVCEWSIPTSAYYFQDRGTMAMISIADAVFAAGGNRGILVAFENGFNGTTAQEGSADPIKNDLAFLGTFQQVSNASEPNGMFAFHKVEPIRVLTPARPSKIRVHFFADDKNEYNISEGCLVLKFEYLSPEDAKEVNYSTSYNPAFPEPKSF